MAQLHIHRNHELGLAAARKVARTWAEQVEAEFDMVCTLERGTDHDKVHFKRSGVQGTLQVSAAHFELDAKLGFLLGAFKNRIEAEIVKNLDDLLHTKPAVKKAPTKTPSRKA